jgi:thiamine-phosphate pyrophosphorylase
MKRYCITDSLDVAGRAARDGVEMIQIRAKQISTRDLVQLARGAVALQGTRVLVNTRTDVALACGAHGVHLPAGSIAPSTVRRIAGQGFLIGVSCHTIGELRAAENEGADFAVFGPVFTSITKSVVPIGIDALRAAASSVGLPVYALGGVTAGNAPLCLEAGAAGVAGISLFM